MIRQILAGAARRKAQLENRPPKALELLIGVLALSYGTFLVQQYLGAVQRETQAAVAAWMFERSARAAGPDIPTSPAAYPGVDDLDPLHNGHAAAEED